MWLHACTCMPVHPSMHACMRMHCSWHTKISASSALPFYCSHPRVPPPCCPLLLLLLFLHRLLQVPRAATIHEYLDWTVTASEAEDPDELDFGGFRVVVLLPRFRPQWPPPPPPGYPAADYAAEEALKHGGLIGAPKPPVPILAVS